MPGRFFLSQSHDSVLAEQVKNYDKGAAHDRIGLAIEKLRLADLDSPAEAVGAVNHAMSILKLVTSGRDPLYVHESAQAMASSRYSGGIARKYGGTGILMAYDALVVSDEARRAVAELLAEASSKFADDAPMFSKTYSVAVFVKFATEIFGTFSGRLACNRSASNLGPY